MLHAAWLGFTHPETGQTMSWDVKPPEDFAVGSDPHAMVVYVPQGTNTAWHINGGHAALSISGL